MIFLSMVLLMAHSLTPHDHSRSFSLSVTENQSDQNSLVDFFITAFLYANPGEKHLEEYNSELPDEYNLKSPATAIVSLARYQCECRSIAVSGLSFFLANESFCSGHHSSDIKDRAPPFPG